MPFPQQNGRKALAIALRRPASSSPPARFPQKVGEGWGSCVRWGLPALCLLVLVASCAEPVYRKRSFVGSTAGKRESVEVPVGLNPLGSLDICKVEQGRSRPDGGGESQKLPATSRVLVSRPENFTQEASQMISALREELGRPGQNLPPVEFMLADRRIDQDEEARVIGIQCAALIVLWEPGFTKTLELTLPHPAQIPLRPLVQERLCEFGSGREQLDILYLTIAGLLTMRDNDYDKAVFYLESAKNIDNGCLRLGHPPSGSGK